MGRSIDCNVKLSDVSVSRLHAVMRHEDGKITLKDRGSKFGTLINCEKVVQVSKSKPSYLQIGKAFMEFSMKNQIEDL